MDEPSGQTASLVAERVAPARAPEPRPAPSRLLRPPGLLVFVGVLLLVALVWWLYADTLTERGVEASGASLVGARVDVEAADVRLGDGSVRLQGLAVANPDA